MRSRLRRKRLCVLAGGTSNEREVSLRSGRNVFSALKEAGYNATLLEVDANFLGHLDALKGVDLFYNALHGTQGEDGVVQGVLEFLGAKYTGENVLNSALSFHKIRAKEMLLGQSVSLPEHIELGSLTGLDWFNPVAVGVAAEAHAEQFGLVLAQQKIQVPFFLKPVESGSSIGVRLVRSEERLGEVLASLLGRGVRLEDYYLEQRIEGREVTVGLYTSKGVLKTLPVLEVVSPSEFYDYEAKYTPGEAKLSRADAFMTRHQVGQLHETAKQIYNRFGYRGCVRMDFIIAAESDAPTFLEANTQPGMTETSDIPHMLREAGVSFLSFCEDLLEQALDQ